MQDLTTSAALDAALRVPAAVLLKHGAHCPISAARDAVQAFADKHSADRPRTGHPTVQQTFGRR